MGKPPKRNAKRSAEQESLRAKAATAAEDDTDDEDDDGEPGEESGFGIWLRQSPSWLISMVVHMLLLIVLGLIGLGIEKQDEIRELVIGDPDVTEEEELEEDNNESLNEELEEEESTEDTEEDDGISVDEYGTEWYEDEVGTWWYREEGAEDWSEYNE